MVIYEAQPHYGLNPAFVVLCIVPIVIFVLLAIFWKKVSLGVRIFLSCIIAFLLFIISCQIYTSVDAWHKVYDEYKARNHLVVEGAITDYTPAEEGEPNLPDRFYVEDVRFSVPGFVSAWGYPLKQDEGGVLENGMKVRIYYIYYKHENVIMRLEILDE